MSITFTLIIQMIVFMILVGFTMKFIWPPLTQAIADRQKKIAEGLAAAERGQTELQTAHGEAQVIVNARVALDPAVLQEQVEREVAAACARRNATCTIQQTQSFRPGRPVPVHRILEAV